MSIVVVGASGQVGQALLQALGTRAVGIGRDKADLLRPASLAQSVQELRPSLLINAAADTAVDRAETDPDPAWIANALAPAGLAAACREVGARMIHFSTDYVFDGTKGSPYTEEDPPAPVNRYGEGKLAGERAVLGADPRNLVFRLSWVYATHGRNFALTMLRLAREGKPIRVVADQVGSPTYARMVAEGVVTAIDQLESDSTAPGGLFHLSCAGETSWAGFARELLHAALGAGAPEVQPITTKDFPTPARRPIYSVLSNEKVGRRFGIRLPTWKEGVAQWARDLTEGS